jgi:hypothetical protein
MAMSEEQPLPPPPALVDYRPSCTGCFRDAWTAPSGGIYLVARRLWSLEVGRQDALGFDGLSVSPSCEDCLSSQLEKADTRGAAVAVRAIDPGPRPSHLAF